MKIIYSYLDQFIQPLPSVETGATLLTACGLEVEHIESIESIRGGLQNVVIGHVLTVVPHPDADRLRVTTVQVADTAEALQIVCGAPNVAVGQKVVVALSGAVLYPLGSEEPLKIKKSKIRGVESNGMICAEDELGIGHSHDGILVLPAETNVGTSAAAYFQLTSLDVIEIGLTPNRTDAMSHWGVARELSAVMQQRGMEHEWLDPFAHETLSYPTLTLPIEIAAESQCAQYSITQIDINPNAETPDWLKRNLAAIGLKTIHPVVDISNWVQHELGQPTHAFDAKSIQGKIRLEMRRPMNH
jgi:phenylalanyl-tRNA synthetase beta chain